MADSRPQTPTREGTGNSSPSTPRDAGTDNTTCPWAPDRRRRPAEITNNGGSAPNDDSAPNGGSASRSLNNDCNSNASTPTKSTL